MELRQHCGRTVHVPLGQDGLEALGGVRHLAGLLRRTAEVHVHVGRRRAVHPRDLHVAAERDRADAVLDALAADLRERRREADVELPRPHPRGAGGEEMARLVHEHEEGEREDGDGEAHAATSASSAARRASASASERGRRGRARAIVGAHERALDELRDREERDPALEERCDGDLVGSVVRARGRATPATSLVGEPEQRERLVVGLVELEREPAQVERRHGRRRAPRVRERVRDRHPHVRQPEMRERCAVAEADERVDGRGRMHEHLDPVVRDPEEHVRLDHLEALVRERGGVDRDLRPHRPGRVRQRLLDGDVRQLRARAAAERAARGRDHERVHLLRLPPLEALQRRRVLAVDREQRAAAAGARRSRERAGRHEALLVRERERDAALQRPEGRADPGEADDRVEDDVRLGPLEQLGRVAAHLGQRREPVDRRRARRGRDELELRVRSDDLEGLAADGAGGSEQCEAGHPG